MPEALKKPIFTEQYWKRPNPREKGDPSADLIALSVGHALSSWERADQELAQLFLILVGPPADAMAYTAIRRAYGAIEGNAGRREAVKAAAEVYFSRYWEKKPVRR